MQDGAALGNAPPQGLALVSCGDAAAPEVKVPALLPGAPGYVAPSGPLPVYTQPEPRGRLGSGWV